jgi:transcriptional regulator GlxA family with amidase domain
LLDAEPYDSAPWQVRRAEDYIEAHWNSPITVEKLAEVTNTSARSIFRAFKASRGYSPMAFAKKLRLKRARAMLQFPKSVSSVIGVAFSCGFSNLGHFAKDYRLEYGEAPSTTLKRSKGSAAL